MIRKVVLISISLLISASSINALADSTSYTCTEIQTNYSGAVTRFYDAVSTAYNYVSQFGCSSTNSSLSDIGKQHNYQDLCNTLTAATESYEAGDYTYPVLKGNYEAIKAIMNNKHGAPDGMNGYIVPMKEQKDSAHHRVKMWDASNANNSNHEPCREYKGCDLGTCSSN